MAYTHLSVMGTPGRTTTFIERGKKLKPYVEPKDWRMIERRRRILRDDEEILEIISIIVPYL